MGGDTGEGFADGDSNGGKGPRGGKGLSVIRTTEGPAIGVTATAVVGATEAAGRN